MFTASHFKLIRKYCLQDLEELLSYLHIPMPNFEMGDEYKIYEDLDRKIELAINKAMMSKSIISGYMNFLTVGGVVYAQNETPKQLLSKILSNQEKIIKGMSTTAIRNEKNDKKTQSSNSSAGLIGAGVGVIALTLGGVALASKPSPLIIIAGLVIGGACIFGGLKNGLSSEKNIDNATTTIKPFMSEQQLKSLLKTLSTVDRIFNKIS